MKISTKANRVARVGVVILLAAQLAPSQVGAAGWLVSYNPPAHAEVVDPFRPPEHIGASGNRGLEYGVWHGDPIYAATDGLVVFAGSVAGTLVVSLLHDDGIKTTYTGLESILVEHHGWVEARNHIATAQPGFHFGAIAGEHYIDPQLLLDASDTVSVASLVPANP